MYEFNSQAKSRVQDISILIGLLSGIHNVMVEKKLYSKMKTKKLILTSSRLRFQIIKGVRTLFRITKEQHLIYQAFGIDKPWI